jgi:hypothetical protein
MLKTNIEMLVSEAPDILNMAHDFFLKVPIEYKPLNTQGSSFVVLGFSNYRWGTLGEDLLRLQDELLSKYDRWFASSKELVTKLSPDRLDTFVESYVKARGWVEKKGEIWINDKEKIFQHFRTNFKVQDNIVSSLLGIIDIQKTIESKQVSEAFEQEYQTNSEFIILKYRVERLEEEIKEQRTQTYSLATGTKGLEIKIQNMATSSADIGNISIDVKNEIIVESIKPILDLEINKLKAIIQEIETENKKEILSTCDEVLSAEKPDSSWLKKKGQMLLDLCKLKPENLEKVSTILQIISTTLSIINSNGQVN